MAFDFDGRGGQCLEPMIDSVKKALEEFRKGNIIIVVDDEDRENEGDFVCAGELVSAEHITFMAIEGRGLICTPMEASWCEKLDLGPMVRENTARQQTAFTVSVDAASGITTGISSADRARTIKLLADASSCADDFIRPGHLFPLRARPGGVRERPGHTEAAVELCQLAGLAPVGVICEIVRDDGEMARMPDLVEKNKKWKLPILSIEELKRHLEHD